MTMAEVESSESSPLLTGSPKSSAGPYDTSSSKDESLLAKSNLITSSVLSFFGGKESAGTKKEESTAKTEILLDEEDAVGIELASSPSTEDIFAEARRHLGKANMAYLLADVRKLADTGFAPFSFDEVCVIHRAEGIADGHVFASIIKVLREEIRDEEEGLAGTVAGKNMHKDRDRSDDRTRLQVLDTFVGLSLEDKGDPVEKCAISSEPLQILVDQHQHVGSGGQCLCTKFGLHNIQVLVDRAVRTEDEKREKEKVESALRGPPPSEFAKLYSQYIVRPPLLEATGEELKEDETIKSLSNPLLTSVFKEQLKPGSYLDMILNDPSSTFHISDKHPDKECVYSISANKEEKTVTVAFRGTVNLENWVVNLKQKQVKRPNPIVEPYDGKEDYVLLHEGFSGYLLRQRQDNQMTKCDEIISGVIQLGNREIGRGDYRLIITGHSLGGSLATIFGFYASADTRLRDACRQAFPVDVFAFANPMVGDMIFFEAFRHQEVSRKIRLVRIVNHWDIVPHGPVTIEWHKRGALYIHVGVGITLREKPGQLPFISYNRDYKNFWAMLFMRIREFALWWVLTFSVDRHHLIGGIVTSIEETIKTSDKEHVSWPGLSGLYEEYVYNTHE